MHVHMNISGRGYSLYCPGHSHTYHAHAMNPARLQLNAMIRRF